MPKLFSNLENNVEAMKLRVKPIEVASFKSYDQATEAVYQLAAKGFPLAGIRIVGKNPLLVENIFAILTIRKVFFSGIIQGLSWGVLFTLLLFFFGLTSPYILAVILACVCIGIISAVISWLIQGRKNKFISRKEFLAEIYCIQVPTRAEEAREILYLAKGNIFNQYSNDANFQGKSNLTEQKHDNSQYFLNQTSPSPQSTTISTLDEDYKSQNRPRYGAMRNDFTPEFPPEVSSSPEEKESTSE